MPIVVALEYQPREGAAELAEHLKVLRRAARAFLLSERIIFRQKRRAHLFIESRRAFAERHQTTQHRLAADAEAQRKSLQFVIAPRFHAAFLAHQMFTKQPIFRHESRRGDRIAEAFDGGIRRVILIATGTADAALPQGQMGNS